MTKTRLLTKPGTGRGMTSGASQGNPSLVLVTVAYTLSIAAASATKSNSSYRKSSNKTTMRQMLNMLYQKELSSLKRK